MEENSDSISTTKYQKLLENKVGLGTKIKEFLDSEGFLVLRAIFYNFEQDVKNKDAYQSLEDFKADRKALRIVNGLFGELDSMVNNAEQAAAELEKLIATESSTPSLLSLDGEGMEDGQDA